LHINDCNSFIFAPKYYEFVQCLSSKAPGKNWGSLNFAIANNNNKSSENQNSSNNSGGNGQFMPVYDSSPQSNEEIKESGAEGATAKNLSMVPDTQGLSH